MTEESFPWLKACSVVLWLAFAGALLNCGSLLLSRAGGAEALPFARQELVLSSCCAAAALADAVRLRLRVSPRVFVFFSPAAVLTCIALPLFFLSAASASMPAGQKQHLALSALAAAAFLPVFVRMLFILRPEVLPPHKLPPGKLPPGTLRSLTANPRQSVDNPRQPHGTERPIGAALLRLLAWMLLFVLVFLFAALPHFVLLDNLPLSRLRMLPNLAALAVFPLLFLRMERRGLQQDVFHALMAAWTGWSLLLPVAHNLLEHYGWLEDYLFSQALCAVITPVPALRCLPVFLLLLWWGTAASGRFAAWYSADESRGFLCAPVRAARLMCARGYCTGFELFFVLAAGCFALRLLLSPWLRPEGSIVGLALPLVVLVSCVVAWQAGNAGGTDGKGSSTCGYLRLRSLYFALLCVGVVYAVFFFSAWEAERAQWPQEDNSWWSLACAVFFKLRMDLADCSGALFILAAGIFYIRRYSYGYEAHGAALPFTLTRGRCVEGEGVEQPGGLGLPSSYCSIAFRCACMLVPLTLLPGAVLTFCSVRAHYLLMLPSLPESGLTAFCSLNLELVFKLLIFGLVPLGALALTLRCGEAVQRIWLPRLLVAALLLCWCWPSLTSLLLSPKFWDASWAYLFCRFLFYTPGSGLWLAWVALAWLYYVELSRPRTHVAL